MSTQTPPIGTLICRRLPENVYDITFIVPEGENSSYQQVIESPLKLADFFSGDASVFIMNEYRAKVINPMVPTIFIEGNILVANGVEYIIKIVQYKPSPRQELILGKLINPLNCKSEIICHGFNIEPTVTEFNLRDGYSCRYETVKKFKKELDSNVVVRVRAPPYCGKTVTLSLLKDYIVSESQRLNNGESVISISCLLFENDREKESNYFNEFWYKRTGDTHYTYTFSKYNYILIDEAQKLYNTARDFWSALKSLSENQTSSTKVLIVSYYGDRPSTGMSTPITIKTIIDYKSLLLTDNEFNELIDSANVIIKRSQTTPVISDQIKTYISKLTGNHVGLIIDTLGYIKKFFANQIGKIDIDNQIATFLASGNFIALLVECRVLPRDSELVKYFEGKYINILNQIIIHPDNYGGIDGSPEEAELVYRGIITETYDLRYRANVLTFSSKLVMNLFNLKYTRAKISLCDAKQWRPDELQGFITATLTKMNATMLKNSFSIHHDSHLLERAWQNEFYRCAFSLLPSIYHTISPDVGYVFGTNGKVDYYINGNLKWMIELMREGNDTTGHLDKFTGGINAKYYPILVQTNYWIILDFRHTMPTRIVDGIWYVNYDFEKKIFIIRIKDDTCLKGYVDEYVKMIG
jgi:hypothetical protein